MAKKAFVSLTGGLNDVDRPDTLEEDQLQECVNYEITGVGRLEKRTDPYEFSEDLTTQLGEIFSEIFFVSEPYYPPNKLDGDYEDFMLFIYGIKKETGEFNLEIAIPGGVIEQEWTGEYRWTRTLGGARIRNEVLRDVRVNKWILADENGRSFMQDLYDAGITYTDKSEIDISIGERNAYISDGVNPIHKVTVTNRGQLVASTAGLKAPKNRPRISLEEMNEQYDAKQTNINYTSDVNDATLGSIGLIQVQYTVVLETGEESNPSPMSDWANAQFFKIAEDGISDERLIKSITVYDLNIPNIPTNLRTYLKYFKIYYRIIRYSEGVELDSMEFSTQKEIKNKTTDATSTGNDYTITSVKSVGQNISYENDAGLPCKVSAVNAGVVMIGGVTKEAAIPGEFQYMTPITIRNPNNKNYVDAVVQVEIDQSKIVDDEGNILMDSWFYYMGGTGDKFAGSQGVEWQSPGSHEAIDKDYYSRHLRIYDTDLTTPIMVYVPHIYYQRPSTGYIDGFPINALEIYVKIPLLMAAADHTIYLCWNKIKDNIVKPSDANPYLISGHTGVEDAYNDVSQYDSDEDKYFPVSGDPIGIPIEESFTWENNIGIHYGRWCLRSDLVNVAQSRQQVFQPRRVPSGSTEILATPNIDELGLGDSENSLYDLPNRANLNNNGEATSIDDPLIVQNSFDPPSGCPIVSTEAQFEDDDIIPDGNAVGDDKIYEFGGEWFPAEAKVVITHIHAANDKVQDHYSAGEHSAYSEDEGFYIKTEEDGVTTVREEHNHTVSDGVGEWKETDDKPFIPIQLYKYVAVDLTDKRFNNNRGLAPITTLNSTGENLNDFVIDKTLDDLAWESFPAGLDRLNKIAGIINPLLPVYQHKEPKITSEYSTSLEKRQDYYSVGAFKPWCGGWSFRKQALSMGKMPDKGYFYTTLTFRKADLVDRHSGSGIAPGGIRWDNYLPSGEVQTTRSGQVADGTANTIFYISCGAINDVDATPNNPVTYYDDHYNSVTQLGNLDVKDDLGYSANANIYQDDIEEDGIGRQLLSRVHEQPRTKLYNSDNFRAVSVTGLSPGDSEKASEPTGSGLYPYSYGSIDGGRHTTWEENGGIDEQDPELDLDPKRNLITLSLEYTKAYTDGNDVELGNHIFLKLQIAGQNIIPPTQTLRILALEPKDDQDFVNLFVYFSWDLIDEKVTLAHSVLDETGDRSDTINYYAANHFGDVVTTEVDLSDPERGVDDFKTRFKDKVLYDIGLGNSTYINRVISGTLYGQMAAGFHNMSGYHGFYGTTELTSGDYIAGVNAIHAMRTGLPKFEIAVGAEYDNNTKNHNISFAATKKRVNKVYDNMIMWSEVGKDGFPDLNYKLLKEPVINIFSAPSFLKFEYSNTFIIFTRNTINRFVLKGTASGWSGSAESLIEEQLQHGLFAPKSLAKIGGELLWFSEEGVIRWSSEGMQNISGNVIDIPLSGDYLGFYCSMGNQYILHDNATYVSYVYDMTYRMWSKFKGLNIISASTLSRGSEAENYNLLLNAQTKTINRYPGTDYTGEDAHIKTMDLFMDSGQIKKVKVDYNGDSSANLKYNLAYNDKDSNNIKRSTTIDGIQKNTWRGLGDLGRLYGRVASFELENADEIFTIIYDAVARGND